MISFNIASTLTVDDEMYQLLHGALVAKVPDQVAAFTWKRFIDPRNWTLIPNPPHAKLPWHKAEFVIKQGPPYTQTAKANVWNSGDLRLDGKPIPHNHPWDEFMAELLMGGYRERRCTVENSRLLMADPYSRHELGDVHVSEVTYMAGSKRNRNYMPHTIFHEVEEVLEPGRTLSFMVCGPGKKEGWGYLEPGTGRYTPHKLSPIDPQFRARLLALNPHRRA